MKLSIAAITLTTLYMQAYASDAPAKTGAPQASCHATVPNCGYPTVPFFRAWSEAATDHFYMTNETELDVFLTEGYVAQGIAAYILPSDTPAPTAVPLFRLYSAQNGDHFYTANTTERDDTLRAGYFVSEGVAGFVYPDQECGTVPLYWLRDNSDSFYTTDMVEVEDFIDQMGYEIADPNVPVAAYVNSQ